jgi:hypothetical protein
MATAVNTRDMYVHEDLCYAHTRDMTAIAFRETLAISTPDVAPWALDTSSLDSLHIRAILIVTILRLSHGRNQWTFVTFG